jgi:hypothetical protein
MTELLKLLKKQRLPLHNEKTLQREIGQLLSGMLIIHDREYRLSDDSIIDFRVGCTGIEVKIGGCSKDIYRQCLRYLEFDELILVTNKAIRLPALINNKPAYVLNLGTAWL